MNQQLQTILDFIQQNENINAEERDKLIKTLKKADTDFTISEFKLERTEKVKRTTAILLEETIEELEQKRKAVEAQNKDLEIEAALERVRTTAMSMHKSDDLTEAVGTVFSELDHLGFKTIRVGIGIFNERANKVNVWVTVAGEKTDTLHLSGDELLEGHPLLEGIYEAWKAQEDYSYTLHGQDLANYYQVTSGSNFPVPAPGENTETIKQYYHVVMFPAGGLFAFRDTAFTEEDKKLMKRFADVFHLSFTRHLDLKQAEAQAREAQVEASLERIRAKAMSMHSSGDLLSVTQVLREQMGVMGETKLESIIIHLYNNVTDDFEAWYSFRNPDDPHSKIVNGKVVLDWSNTARARMDKEMYQSSETEYTITADRNILAEWYNYLNIVVPEVVEEDKQGNIIVPEVLYYNYSKFDSGALLLITNSEASDHSKNLLRRSSKVFNLAYTRFLDLQKAEAQAKDAVKQASLDRVRGEIASMRSTEDLKIITPLVFNELTTLGVPFIRCGVFIIHENVENVEVYLSAPDGHSLGVLHLPFQANDLTENAVEYWRNKKVYHQHWNKEEFINWTKSLLEQGQIQNEKAYQGAAVPPESLDLHFIPFTQGMLYVGNTNPLSIDEIDLVKALAEAFAMAYARYEDFTKLEKAKESIESTLIELKATQSQLIQSEKMASLGQLTAGIAHEIQNPLNFVNNFSEVSTELVDEMNEEIKKGNLDDVKQIAQDLKQNLEKINHHGKRAGEIVKSMLQHSHASSGQKEPTDINALADEYLRLAYHGFRAKDKTFNAAMKTDYDESIGLIKITTQDIGRVILNLITNAFYAAPLPPEGGFKDPSYKHEPTIWMTTKKEKDKVLIFVRDNGPGIPKNILDKIFQPFFTTKPTGQGTGLGLSLSYDIVKAHGGELKVETVEGEGSTFIISLPANNK